MSQDRLEPWHIIRYFMHCEVITCKCGQTQAHERLWMEFDKDRSKVSRPVGRSEQIYEGIRIDRTKHEYATAACPACLSTIKKEAWSIPAGAAGANAARSNVLGQLKASKGFAASAGYGTTTHKGVSDKNKPLSELLDF